MNALTPAQRRELRAKAHHLHPVVIVGHHGLTPAVLHEIDVNLLAHELIKIRVFSEDREQREAMLERICAALDAASVQHIGKLLVLWRPAPEPMPAVETRTADKQRRRQSRAGAKAKTMAKSTPQARRPRSPLARTTTRKTTTRAPSSKTRQPSTQAARRRRQAG